MTTIGMGLGNLSRLMHEATASINTALHASPEAAMAAITTSPQASAPVIAETATQTIGEPPRQEEQPALAPATRFLSEAEVAEAVRGQDPTSVTAEGMLQTTDQRLREVDTQILGMYSMMNERRVQSSAISTDMQHLQELQTALSAIGKKPDDNVKLSDLTVNTQTGSFNALDFIRDNHLESALGMDSPTGETKINGTQVTSGVDTLRQSQSQLNGRTEMDMLHMQELVQQRGQVIEMATKLLEAMNQSLKAILANLGR